EIHWASAFRLIGSDHGCVIYLVYVNKFPLDSVSNLDCSVR
ncbi:unnamed protein product, partial [marine sediment metagenome]